MSVLVIGESCVDEFVYGDINRMSPEAPVPIIEPTAVVQNGGMALNTYNNFLSLNVDVDIITNEKNEIRKVRYVDNRSNQMVLRVDENDSCLRNSSLPIMNNQWNNKKYEAIVISDYCKGFLEEEDIQYICENNKNVFIDTKKKLGRWVKDADFIKINELEYKRNHELLSDKGFEEKLIVTLGAKGCRWNGKEFPVEEVPVKDVSGAGDTFMAGLVYEYIRSNNIISAIEVAQKCTTLVVQKHGVSTVKLKEIK